MLITFFLSCSKSDEGKLWNLGKDTITNEDASTIIYDGLERKYILYVPDSYDGNSSFPLMFNFHGYGGTATGQMYLSDMRPLADTADFILVYPQGSYLGNSESHWNTAPLSEDNKSDVDDFGFINALINEISSSHNIDTNRIYACGYSNGAGFSFSIACFTNRIAAIASVSGLMSDVAYDNCNPSHPIGIIIFHGTSDDVRPYDGIDGGLLSVNDALNYWTNFNHTDSIPNVNNINDNGLIFEHYEYLNGDNNSSVEHYKIFNGEHVWFDINYQGLNINHMIWNFLSSHEINDLR